MKYLWLALYKLKGVSDLFGDLGRRIAICFF